MARSTSSSVRQSVYQSDCVLGFLVNSETRHRGSEQPSLLGFLVNSETRHRGSCSFIHNTPTRKRSHQAQDIHTSHTSHPLHSNARRHVTHTALTDTDQSRHTPAVLLFIHNTPTRKRSHQAQDIAVHSFSQGAHHVSQILSCGTYEGQCTVGPHLGQLAGSSAASRHSTRAAARHDQSVSQSVISRSRPALRPLSDVRPLSPSQRTAPLPPVERSPNSLMRSRVKAAWFFEWNSIWWNWSAPLVRRWYAACAGNRALAVTRLDDHFFQGLLWARRLNLGRGPSSPAPSPDTSPGRTKSFSDFRWT